MRFGIGDCASDTAYFAAGLVESADKLPGALEDARFFDAENGGVGVEARGECLRAFDLFVDVEMERFGLHGNSSLKTLRNKK
jgi:hypothetical protein